MSSLYLYLHLRLYSKSALTLELDCTEVPSSTVEVRVRVEYECLATLCEGALIHHKIWSIYIHRAHSGVTCPSGTLR